MFTTVVAQLGHVLGTLEGLESRLSRIQHGAYAADVAAARAALRLESSRLHMVREQLSQRTMIPVDVTALNRVASIFSRREELVEDNRDAGALQRDDAADPDWRVNAARS